MEIETPVLLAYVIEDSTDIFRISGGGGFEHPKPPLSVRHWFEELFLRCFAFASLLLITIFPGEREPLDLAL